MEMETVADKESKTALLGTLYDETTNCLKITGKKRGWFSMHKSVEVIHHINKSKNKII